MDANACAQSPWPSFYVALLIAYSLVEYGLGRGTTRLKARSMVELMLQAGALLGVVVLTLAVKFINRKGANNEQNRN